MELKYDNGTTPQYNGNISNQVFTNSGSNTFTYAYDLLNRLTSGAATGMSEALSYDNMGNIVTLNRDGAGVSTYTYNGNRLSSISGSSVSTATNYAYDSNGNATTDGRNEVTLTYNHLNLPVTANKSGLALAYTYDAAGNKLTKVNSTTGITTHYLRGIQYTGSNIDFVQTEEGIARRSGSSYSYEYNLEDHLGNTRATFYRNPSSGNIEVLQRDDYYAFGKRKLGTPSNDNKYLYNGKELQDELGQYDYGARFYDPVIGRWIVVDPLAETYQDWSPYNYGLDDPIGKLDPNGMWVETAGGYSTNDKTEIAAFLKQQKSSQQSGGPEPKDKKAKESSFAQQLLDGTPFVGKGMSGGKKLMAGDYVGATADLGTASAELFTLGFGAGLNSFTDDLIGLFTKNVAKTGTSVLGKYPDYINLASEIGAKRFSIPTNIWNRMSASEQWAANQKFLDRIIARGDKIILSNPVKDVNKVSGAFRQELDYLIDKGYRLNSKGTQLTK